MRQRRTAGEIVKPPGTTEPGKLVEAGYARMVRALLGSTSTPVNSAELMGAWTHAVFDAAKAYEQ